MKNELIHEQWKLVDCLNRVGNAIEASCCGVSSKRVVYRKATFCFHGLKKWSENIAKCKVVGLQNKSFLNPFQLLFSSLPPPINLFEPVIWMLTPKTPPFEAIIYFGASWDHPWLGRRRSVVFHNRVTFESRFCVALTPFRTKLFCTNSHWICYVWQGQWEMGQQKSWGTKNTMQSSMNKDLFFLHYNTATPASSPPPIHGYLLPNQKRFRKQLAGSHSYEILPINGGVFHPWLQIVRTTCLFRLSGMERKYVSTDLS